MNRAIFIVSLVGLTMSSGIMLSEIGAHISQTIAARQNAGPASAAGLTLRAGTGLPVRIKIPSIGVDAAIMPVGLAADGAMDVPKDPAAVAWFELGTHPGDNGSAVIAGHYGWIGGIPAVFDSLYKIQKGDKIYVEDERRSISVFVVREIRPYGEKADAADIFGSPDGKPHLNLVTCEGVWNNLTQSYSKRLVVFADKQ